MWNFIIHKRKFYQHYDDIQDNFSLTPMYYKLMAFYLESDRIFFKAFLHKLYRNQKSDKSKICITLHHSACQFNTTVTKAKYLC